MKTVLVTGANGFVGNYLVKELKENGYQVVGIGGKRGSHQKSPYIDKYLSLDLDDPKEAQSVVFQEIDSVIHLAGLATPSVSFNEARNYITTNMGIEVNLFEAARSQDAHPSFLIVSSGTLYNPKAKLPIDEESDFLATSPYAVSKIGQEQLARYYLTRDFECIIARPFNHIGPGQSLGFIASDLAKQIAEAKKGLIKELMVGNLESKRDYTDVKDIVRAYRLLIENGRNGEVYNICSGVPVSGEQILEGLLKAAEVQVPIKQDPSKNRPSDTPILYGSHKKLTKDTGWEPSIKLDKTLEAVMRDWETRV